MKIKDFLVSINKLITRLLSEKEKIDIYEKPVLKCAKCGSTENLNLMLVGPYKMNILCDNCAEELKNNGN